MSDQNLKAFRPGIVVLTEERQKADNSSTRRITNTTMFQKILERRIEKIREVLSSKGEEYSANNDRLHNFRLAAMMSGTGETPEQALWGMARKHIVSVIDIINDTRSGIRPSIALRDEKIGDAINYLILLEALLSETDGDVKS